MKPTIGGILLESMSSLGTLFFWGLRLPHGKLLFFLLSESEYPLTSQHKTLQILHVHYVDVYLPIFYSTPPYPRPPPPTPSC